MFSCDFVVQHTLLGKILLEEFLDPGDSAVFVCDLFGDGEFTYLTRCSKGEGDVGDLQIWDKVGITWNLNLVGDFCAAHLKNMLLKLDKISGPRHRGEKKIYLR